MKEADERRAELYEEAKRFEHRKKMDQLERQNVENQLEEKPIFNKTLESSMLLPLLSKFEALSKISEEEQSTHKRILRRERKKRTFKNKSKQILTKIVSSIQTSQSRISQELTKTQLMPKTNQENMKNYLISHVLFDADESVRTLNKHDSKNEETVKNEKNIDKVYTIAFYFGLFHETMGNH